MMVASSRVSPSPPQPALTPEATSEPTTSTDETVATVPKATDTLSSLMEAVSSSSTSPTNTSSDASSVICDFANLFAVVQQQQQQSQNTMGSDAMDVSSPQPPPSSGAASDGSVTVGEFATKTDFPAMKTENFSLVKQEINPMESLLATAALDPTSFWQMLQQHNDFLNSVNAVQRVQQAQLQRIQQQGTQDRKRSSPSTFQYCELCQKDVHSSKLPCHIRQYHVGQPMFQCPACEFASTYSKNNVKSHMVSLHGLAGDPVSFMEKYAPQVEQFMKVCFPHVRGRGMSVRGRGRHMQSRPSPRSSASPQLKTSSLNIKPNISQMNNLSNFNFPGASGQFVLPSGQDNNVQRKSSVDIKPNINRGRDEFLLMTQPQHSLLAQSNPLSLFGPALLNGNFNNNNNNNNLKEKMSSVGLDCSLSGRETMNLKFFNMDDVHLDSPLSIRSYDSSDDEQNCDYVDHVMALVFSEPSSSREQSIITDRIESRYARGLINSIRVRNYQILRQNWWLRSYADEDPTAVPTCLLTPNQITEVAIVRNELLASKPSFEILFGLNRMDLTLLPAPLVEKVLMIAPSELDSKVISMFAQEFPHTITTDEERFLIELARIDRLEDKLAIMMGMAKYDERLSFIEKRVVDCTLATRRVCQSKQLVELASFIKRLLPSDDAFAMSKLSELCDAPNPDGSKVFESVVQHVVANPNLSEVFDLIAPIRAVYLTNMHEVASAIKSFFDLARHCEREVSQSTSPNELLNDFSNKIGKQYTRLYKLYNKLKSDFYQVYSYMCEDHTTVSVTPLKFLGEIADFLEKLQTSLIPAISAEETENNK